MDDTLKEKYFEFLLALVEYEAKREVLAQKGVNIKDGGRVLNLKLKSEEFAKLLNGEANTIPKEERLRVINKFDLHAASITRNCVDIEFTPTEVSVTPNDNVVESKLESECTVQVSDEYIKEFPGKLIFGLNGEDRDYIPKDKVKEIVGKADRVMKLLNEHGAGIVPHLMDTDENAGQELREAIGEFNLNNII